MKITIKIIAALTSLLLLCSVFAAAHSSSQVGILEQNYIADYGRNGIGGENIGWSIDERYHIGTRVFQYKFINVPTALKEVVRDAAELWMEVATITESSSATGEFSCFEDFEDNSIAVFAPISINTVTGHLTQWLVGMNSAHTITARDVAHEFGHVIGLNDLFHDSNMDKLMFYTDDSTASMPTGYDLLGAKVILGIHTTHTFENYRIWGRDSNGDRYHVQYCSVCNGNSATHAPCVFPNTLVGVCFECGYSMNLAG